MLSLTQCFENSLSIKLHIWATPKVPNIWYQRVRPTLHYVFSNRAITPEVIYSCCITWMNFMGKNLISHYLKKKIKREGKTSKLMLRLMSTIFITLSATTHYFQSELLGSAHQHIKPMSSNHSLLYRQIIFL